MTGPGTVAGSSTVRSLVPTAVTLLFTSGAIIPAQQIWDAFGLFAPLWLRLKVSGENISTIGNQSPEVAPVTLHGYIDCVGGNVLRCAHKLDPSPDWLHSGT